MISYIKQKLYSLGGYFFEILGNYITKKEQILRTHNQTFIEEQYLNYITVFIGNTKIDLINEGTRQFIHDINKPILYQYIYKFLSEFHYDILEEYGGFLIEVGYTYNDELYKVSFNSKNATSTTKIFPIYTSLELAQTDESAINEPVYIGLLDTVTKNEINVTIQLEPFAGPRGNFYNDKFIVFVDDILRLSGYPISNNDSLIIITTHGDNFCFNNGDIMVT